MTHARTETYWLLKLDTHASKCKDCARDPQGWIDYRDMCDTGRRLVQSLADAPDDEGGQ